MMKIIDITGERYGRLTVLSFTGTKDKNGRYLWKCKCDCGNEIIVNRNVLRNKGVQSCGCLREESRFKDYTGEKYGRLTAIKPTGEVINHSAVWVWKCDCGNTIECPADNVMSGRRSCGCLEKETKIKACKNMQKKIIRIDGTNINRIKSNKIPRNNTSGAIGVSWHKKAQKWAAHIQFKGRIYHLGYYNTVKEASEAYQKAKDEIHRSFIDEYESKSYTK